MASGDRRHGTTSIAAFDGAHRGPQKQFKAPMSHGGAHIHQHQGARLIAMMSAWRVTGKGLIRIFRHRKRRIGAPPGELFVKRLPRTISGGVDDAAAFLPLRAI